MELKITKIRNSLAIILPPEVTAKLKLSEGDSWFVVDRPSGAYITSHRPAIETQRQLGLEFMAEYRATFQALAK